MRSPDELRALCDELKDRLLASPGRSLQLPGVSLREAAVLVPLLWRDGQPWVLLTRRPQTLRTHGGQISFPGGSRDPSDESPLHAALRETWEELGIPGDRVEVLGMLDESPTITGFRIQPFVGVIPADHPLRPSPVEIEEVIEVPLRHLLRTGTSRTEVWQYGGEDHLVYFFDYAGHVIWGATARILVNLFERAAGLPSFEALR